MLAKLHGIHQGETRMKQMARKVIWFPGIDGKIEDYVKGCGTCQTLRPAIPRNQPVSWKTPGYPFERVHVDFLGPFEGHQVFVLSDAFSGWIEARIVRSTSTDEVIRVTEEIFDRFGVPRTLVSDNGTAFTSERFKAYVKKEGITHVLTPAYHPASNGVAERAVGIVKGLLKRNNKGPIERRLREVMRQYRQSPSGDDGHSPAERFLGWRPRSTWNLLLEPRRGDSSFVDTYEAGQLVWIRDPLSRRWGKGRVLQQKGVRVARVQLQNGRTRDVHMDHLRKRSQTDGLEDVTESGTDAEELRRAYWMTNWPETQVELEPQTQEPLDGRAREEVIAMDQTVITPPRGTRIPTRNRNTANREVVTGRPRLTTNRPQRQIRAPVRFR